MTAPFDWTPLAATGRAEAVPEMVKRALAVLEDLLAAPDHNCTFRLDRAPAAGDDLTSANRVLPPGCHASRMHDVESWQGLVVQELPERFLPGWPDDESWAWAKGTPARRLADDLTAWTVSLLRRLWPDAAPAFIAEIECEGFYEMDYVDLFVHAGLDVWLLHLGVSD